MQFIDTHVRNIDATADAQLPARPADAATAQLPVRPIDDAATFEKV